ncbi:CvpA family protein [bacterium]|nr:CvpA family protein [bacterium]
MGIVIDIILVLIVALSAFLGYKKGLVELGAKLFAGIIAIVITLIIYKPVGNIVIKNTSIDEKIENTILEKTTNVIYENSKISDNKYIQDASDNAVSQVKEEVLPEQARNIAVNVVYGATALILFIVSKIVLSIVISLANAVASLPILKQFNEVGGFLYGLVRGAIISLVLILVIGTIAKLNPNGSLSKNVESTYLLKEVYDNVVKIK